MTNEGQPPCLTIAEQIAYLKGTEETLRTSQAWAKADEYRLRQNLFNSQVETLSRVMRILNVELPLIPASHLASTEDQPGEKLEEAQIKLIQQAAKAADERGVFVNNLVPGNPPPGINPKHCLDLGVHLLPDGSLKGVFYIPSTGEFTKTRIYYGEALEGKLPTLALGRLKDYIQQQDKESEKQALETLRQQLEAHFSESNPQGLIRSEYHQKEWELLRNSCPLGRFFPKQGHKECTELLLALKRAEIKTLEDLLAKSPEEISIIRGIGSKKLEAALLIRDHLSSSHAQV